MSKGKMDMAKVLAILAQPKEAPPPLENVERLNLEIAYINKEETVHTRPVRVVMPCDAPKPMPLIYVPHYEMGEDAVELREYLSKGWAVASPAAFNDKYNAGLTDDDLVFNNAALYTLRNRPEFDRDRIILVGGSAGGYMTLMLSGLQLNLCASIANGPIANVYFNFQHHFNKANALNYAALAKMAAQQDTQTEQPENPALALMQKLQALPIPFIAALGGIFAPVTENLPDKSDWDRWVALSPVGVADCFCSPVMVNHCTSDILVPVDQISKKYTYDIPGESLPADFSTRIPAELPGKAGMSLEECLPAEKTATRRIIVPEEAGEDTLLPYDIEKQFNLNIYDDGPVEGYGSHSARMDVGRRIDLPYLEEMFARTAAENCVLTPAMLRRLVARWQGRSVALPAHTGVDDNVYGSLAVYRHEIRQELAHWAGHHGKETLMQMFAAVPQIQADPALQAVVEEMTK